MRGGDEGGGGGGSERGQTLCFWRKVCVGVWGWRRGGGGRVTRGEGG